MKNLFYLLLGAVLLNSQPLLAETPDNNLEQGPTTEVVNSRSQGGDEDC